MGASFIRGVEEACTKALVDVGMTKRRRGICTMHVAAGFQGWCGLNAATRIGNGTMIVNPVVGLRCDAIHEVLSKVAGKRPHAYVPPTVASNIGYLQEEASFRGYEFSSNRGVAAEAVRLADSVAAEGFEFMKAHADLGSLLAGIPRWCARCEAFERTMAVHFLLDDLEAIEEQVEEERAAEDGPSKTANLDFAIRFRSTLGLR